MRKQARPAGAGTPLDRIRELAALLDEYGLSSISASWGGVEVRLQRRPAPSATAPASPILPAAALSPTPKPSAVEAASATQATIEAPMVGTFYRAPSPGADPYVREGDTIKEGQVLCIIEAMKLMNEIEAKLDGRIVQILVENGMPVEYGQPLFIVEPLR
jgi:acetyl-CoA carboxylase biotin carboxyl carrier protein